MKTAKEIFKAAVKGENFMTPTVLGYYEIKNGACELSKGSGIFSDEIFGVTVVKDGENNHELSDMFTTEEEAREYIKELKK